MPLTKEERAAAIAAARLWPKGFGDDITWAVQQRANGQYVRCLVDVCDALL